MEEALKVVLDMKEERRRAKRRAEKERATGAEEEKNLMLLPLMARLIAMEVDGEEKVYE
jgi:hypothetical protein